jgi:amidase
MRAGELTSEAVVSACLERIALVNPDLNAVVQLRAAQAIEDARAADRALAAGQLGGPLHGVPITIKDSFDTADLVTTAGTTGRRGFVPDADATVVARLRAAGAIVLGKTNTPELTLAYDTDNLVYGATRNPCDLSRSTGGSSGGSAAIVAAWGSPLDLGSDTAGSIRYPAHCCGVAGLKPTSGRVPRTGHIIGPEGLPQALTTIGPLARRVEDLELALHVIAGPDQRDPHIVPMPLLASASVDLRGLRAALFTSTALATADADVRAAATRAAEVLSGEGVEVEMATLPDIEQAFDLFPRLFGADGCAGLEAFLAMLGTSEASPPIRGAIRLLRTYAISAHDLGNLIVAIDLWRSRALTFMDRYDLILCPAASTAAPHPVGSWDDPATAWPPGLFSWLVPFNFTGWPVVVVRAGTSASGLPIGVQCVARAWREDVALRAAGAIEGAL